MSADSMRDVYINSVAIGYKYSVEISIRNWSVLTFERLSLLLNDFVLVTREARAWLYD